MLRTPGFTSQGTSRMSTPEQRSSSARKAAHTKWAHTVDRTAATAPARRASLARFEREVDPDGVLNPELRAKLAENAKRAFFVGIRAMQS